jgi:hypothetical protein
MPRPAARGSIRAAIAPPRPSGTSSPSGGRIVHCIGWWNRFPVEEISGIMVAQTNRLDPRDTGSAIWKGSIARGVGGQVWPQSLQEPVMSLAEQVDAELDSAIERALGSFAPDRSELERRLREDTRWSLRADAVYLRIAEHISTPQDPSTSSRSIWEAPT